MKEEKIINTFTCDNCGKRSEGRDSIDGFPYNDGWRYLYNLSVKNSKKDQKEIKDKHFCSGKCREEFIVKKLKESDQ
jgi:hypothetical protein